MTVHPSIKFPPATSQARLFPFKRQKIDLLFKRESAYIVLFLYAYWYRTKTPTTVGTYCICTVLVYKAYTLETSAKRPYKKGKTGIQWCVISEEWLWKTGGEARRGGGGRSNKKLWQVWIYRSSGTWREILTRTLEACRYVQYIARDRACIYILFCRHMEGITKTTYVVYSRGCDEKLEPLKVDGNEKWGGLGKRQ